MNQSNRPRLPKPFVLYLLLAVFSTNFVHAQINSNDVINTGKSIFGNKKEKKKEEAKKNDEAKNKKDIEASISEVTMNGHMVSLLRVSEEKITSPAKRYILKVQERLQANYLRVQSSQHIEDFSSNIQNDIYDLKAFDAEWPVTYYETELREYKAYDERLTQTEKRINDSTEIATRVEQQRLRDSAKAEDKRIADSLAYDEQTRDYHFVNKAFTELKEKGSAKSATIAKVYGGTYVKVWEINEKTGYASVAVDDLEGYVLYADLVEYLEEIDFDNADMDLYKSKRYFSYARNEVYFEKLYKAEEAAAAAEERKQARSAGSGSGRKYITGEKGGCYYINASGNKQYVDRSLCR